MKRLLSPNPNKALPILPAGIARIYISQESFCGYCEISDVTYFFPDKNTAEKFSQWLNVQKGARSELMTHSEGSGSPVSYKVTLDKDDFLRIFAEGNKKLFNRLYVGAYEDRWLFDDNIKMFAKLNSNRDLFNHAALVFPHYFLYAYSTEFDGEPLKRIYEILYPDVLARSCLNNGFSEEILAKIIQTGFAAKLSEGCDATLFEQSLTEDNSVLPLICKY